MLSSADRAVKRTFDVVFSVVGLCLTWWLILAAWVIASVETRSNGIFMQKRVGQDGRLFTVFKIKTMKPVKGMESTVTTADDTRITKSGALLRRWKIDELPQLLNVLLGSMSFVGPRPDVPGFADRLTGEEREILSLKPGITGPATLQYKNEEALLARQKDPERYNREVIWPDKVRINRQYMQEWSLKKDIIYMIKTITG